MTKSDQVAVLIPTPLRRFTEGEARVTTRGDTVGEVLDTMERQYPGFGERIREPNGQIRRFVNVFLNGESVRDLNGIATPVAPGDELGIIPAMAGGRG